MHTSRGSRRTENDKSAPGSPGKDCIMCHSHSLSSEDIVRIRYVRHASEHIRIYNVTEFERWIAVWPRRTHPHNRASGRLAFIDVPDTISHFMLAMTCKRAVQVFHLFLRYHASRPSC